MNCEKCKLLSDLDRYDYVVDAAKDNSYKIAADCISEANIDRISVRGFFAGFILSTSISLAACTENTLFRMLIGLPGMLYCLFIMVSYLSTENSIKEKAANRIFKSYLLKMHTEKYLSDQESREFKDILFHSDNIDSVQDLKEKAYEIDYSLRYGCYDLGGNFPKCEELRSKISERTNLEDF